MASIYISGYAVVNKSLLMACKCLQSYLCQAFHAVTCSSVMNQLHVKSDWYIFVLELEISKHTFSMILLVQYDTYDPVCSMAYFFALYSNITIWAAHLNAEIYIKCSTGYGNLLLTCDMWIVVKCSYAINQPLDNFCAILQLCSWSRAYG